VNPALFLLASVTIGGAVLASSTRDVRTAVLGLLLVFLGAPLLADPWPSPAALIVRAAAALLATRFAVIGLRGATATGGGAVGLPALALVAVAAAIVGFGSHGPRGTGLGPPEVQAAAFALIALGIGMVGVGRDVLRLSLGAVILVVGASLLRTALGSGLTDGDQLIAAVLTVGLGGGLGVVTAAGTRAGSLDVDREELAGPTAAHRVPRDRLPDAHPAGRTPAAARSLPTPSSEPTP
jgi:hypothetical protein